MVKGVIAFLVVLVVAAAGFVFLKGFGGLRFGMSQTPAPSIKVDYSKEYPEEVSGDQVFVKKKTSDHYVAYYNQGEEINANKSLNLLEQAGVPLYQKYLAITPKQTPIYFAASVDEYVKVANFPGGKENVKIGDGSAPMGKIYLYKPFDDKTPGKTEGMIVHEGVHAAIFQMMGNDRMRYLPGFINEGLAHYIEYVFKAGPDFGPLDQIYHSDLLIAGVKTGKPKLLNLEELGRQCDGYIGEETLNFLCRGQGTYTVWFVSKNYGVDAWGKFLADLKQNNDWQQSLGNLTKKTIPQLGADITDQLKSMAEK